MQGASFFLFNGTEKSKSTKEMEKKTFKKDTK